MRYVIIGGDAAGMSAAMQIVRNDENAEVITLEQGEIYSYAQCGLPYVIGELIPSTDTLIARSVDTFRHKYGINAYINHRVENIDPNEKLVHGKDTSTGKPFKFHYDKLLIATGANPVMPNFKGTHFEGVHLLKTIPDAQRIMKDLDKRQVEKVIIIGGGYIGLEMAEAFTLIGKEVTMIQRSAIAKMFDADMAAHIHKEAEKHGITIRTNEQVEAMLGEKHVEKVKTDKATYDTDLVLVATGIRPNTEVIKGTNIVTGVKGAIRVNRFMETNVEDIYAAGDCAEQYHLIKEKNDYIPLGTTANKQGRIAGLNMVGKSRSFKGTVGTSVIKFMELTLGRTGISEKEAAALHIPYKSITIKSTDIAKYYPESEPLHVKLIYRSDTKQLLGGQVIGKNGVDKRVDVLATALFNGMSLHELEDVDLGYTPPYNSVWDPLQQAARRGK